MEDEASSKTHPELTDDEKHELLRLFWRMQKDPSPREIRRYHELDMKNFKHQ